MGRSAKMMKRPTKAEKVSRTVNAPPSTRPVQRERSLSPDTTPRSAIPLFNTSAKRLQSKLRDYDPMSLDSSKAPTPSGSDMELEADGTPSGSGPGSASASGKGLAVKKSLKDKLRAAKESVRTGDDKAREKLGQKKLGPGAVGRGRKEGVLKGQDYLTLHEGRNAGTGGRFEKKLR